MTPWFPVPSHDTTDPSQAPQPITIREARFKIGMSQDDLAEQSGVVRQRISDIELGKVTNPFEDNVAAVTTIATALGVDLCRLTFAAHLAAKPALSTHLQIPRRRKRIVQSPRRAE